MSDYKLKIYQEEFLEAQEKIGNEATKEWDSFGQTPAERLKEVYSRPDFDPETRHYCLLNDEVVGFMVSRVLPETEDGIKRAQHDFPFVLKGHEKAIDLLYDKAITTLKKKGVKILEARVGEGWLGTIDLAKKYGYKFARRLFVRTGLDLAKTEFGESEVNFVEYDHSKDKEQMVQMFMDLLNMDKEQAEANFEEINQRKDLVVSHPLLFEGEKIISRGLVHKTEDDPKVAVIRPLIPEPKLHLKSCLAGAAKTAKEAGIERFQLFLGGPNIEELLDLYTPLGFSIEVEVQIYEKEI